MANYCSNNIAAGATNSEWKEISKAFENDLIDWPISMEGTDCNDWSKEISCTTNWSPTPWNEGKMGKLSESYPCVLFHYVTDIEGEYRSPSTWFCNGDEHNKREAESSRRQAYKAAVKRFTSATSQAAEGIYHRVEVMPDGRVAADGENRFGECNIFPWTNIKAVSCGNWHTVGLRNDGSVVACGSNANGQCDVSHLGEKAIAISSGRYHTAILLASGKVVVHGNLEQEASAPAAKEEPQLTASDFPMVVDMRLDKYISGWEKMNDRIETISAGDELTLKKISKDGEISFEVLNARGEKLGELWIAGSKSLAKLLKNIKVTANTVTPLSTRRKGSKYAAMTLRLDYSAAETNSKPSASAASMIGDYKQTKYTQWPPVAKIISIFDAVIGVSANGDFFVDGFCPCSEVDLTKIIAQL